jgi:hypothetical protein
VENDKEHGICHVPGPGEPDDVWWLGFDCVHGGDNAPSRSYTFYGRVSYRTLRYVQDECASLARQIREACHV